jgi:hypothetical protein
METSFFYGLDVAHHDLHSVRKKGLFWATAEEKPRAWWHQVRKERACMICKRQFAQNTVAFISQQRVASSV